MLSSEREPTTSVVNLLQWLVTLTIKTLNFLMTLKLYDLDLIFCLACLIELLPKIPFPMVDAYRL